MNKCCVCGLNSRGSVADCKRVLCESTMSPCCGLHMHCRRSMCETGVTGKMDAAELVEHDTEDLVPIRGVWSVVWRVFGFQKSDVDQTTILCKCCRAKSTSWNINQQKMHCTPDYA